MVILCDTCAILMLIRIAPDMFKDHRYETITISGVSQEFIRTQKFKDKYSWRSSCRSLIVPEPESKYGIGDYNMIYDLVSKLLDSGVINARNDRLFDLSRVDKQVVSYAIANECTISTGDQGIIDFASQEFTSEFKGNISPLELINKWISSNLIVWDDAKHRILEEWTLTGERSQPRSAITRFKKITGKDYPGP